MRDGASNSMFFVEIDPEYGLDLQNATDYVENETFGNFSENLSEINLCPKYPNKYKFYMVLIFITSFAFPMVIIIFSYYMLLKTVKVRINLF